MRKRHLLAVACLGIFSSHLKAQTAFVLPGPTGTTSNASAFSVSPFSLIGNFTLPGSNTTGFQAISRFDGGEFYIISNSSTNTVTTLNSLLGNITTLPGFGQGATAAILTPDTRRILVAAGNLQIINTANDSLANPAGISVGGTAVDVGASIDSTQAYVLVNTGNGYLLDDVDLRLLQSIKTLPIVGQASGVTVGPNGLVYVGTTNALLEIDPTTLTVRNAISANGTPGKPAFTPDGKLALTPNLTPSTQAALFIFDLTLKSAVSPGITTSSIPNAVSRVFAVSNTLAYVYSASTQSLFVLQIGSQSVSTFPFGTSGSVSFVATTTDLATTSGTQQPSTHPTTKYLLFGSGGVLNELDINNNQIVGNTSITGQPGALSIATPANTAGFPTTVLAYGDQQTVPLSTASAPLVVRAVDANGKPVVGVGVTFGSASSISIQTTSALTNADGLASTTVTGGATGTVQVTATVGSGLGYTFTVNIGATSTGPPTGGGNPSGLTVTSGQGVIVPAGAAVSAANGNPNMGVLYADTNGNPVAGAAITYTVTSGLGTVLCPNSPNETFSCSSTSSSSVTVNTDSKGIAMADYQTGFESFTTPTDFSQASITATAPNGTSATFYVTSFPDVFHLPTLSISTSPGATFSGSAGQTLTGAITGQFSSFTGTPIPNVSLRIANPPDPTKSPSANCAGIFAMSNANGAASCDLVLSGAQGTTSVFAEIGYVQDFGPFNISVTAGVPGKVTILQGNNQSGKPGQALPVSFSVQVTDANGNVLPQTPVSWKVLSGTITLSQVSSATDSNGKASAQATLGNTPGTAQVQVTAGTGAAAVSATFTATITVPIGGIQIVSGNNQLAPQNSPFANPLVVKVTDANNNPVAGLAVAFTVTSGSATVATPSATSDANGNASTNVSAGGTAGPVVVSASSNGFSVTFNLTVIPPGPSNIVFLNGASLQAGASAGAIVTIQGTGLANGVVGVVVPNNVLGPLPTTLAGVTVTFNGTPAPIFSVSNVNGTQQVTVQVPYEVAGLGTASVLINVAGGGSGTFTVNLKPYSPGVFNTNVFGVPNFLVAIRPDGSYVSPTNPAHRGEALIVFVTGLGQTTPLIGTNESGIPNQNVAANIAVGFNNSGTPYISAQSVVGLVGVYAITLTVPVNTATGPQQPFGLIVYDASGNAIFANSPVLAIQ